MDIHYYGDKVNNSIISLCNKDLKTDLVPDDIEMAVKFIQRLTSDLQATLKESSSTAKISSYPPAPRGTSIDQDEIQVVNYDNALSLKKGIDAFSFEKKNNDITVPTKYVGTIEIPKYLYPDILDRVSTINSLKLVVKKGSKYAIPNRNERRKFFNELIDGVITSTIYRQIIIKPNVQLSSFTWCSKQKAPIPLSAEEIENIIDLSGPQQSESSIEHKSRIERFKVIVESHICKSESIYRLMNVRLHPVQQLTYYTDDGSRTRLPYKVSLPIIITRSNSEYRSEYLGNYCADSSNSEANKFPERYGQFEHIGFGFYRKK